MVRAKRGPHGSKGSRVPPGRKEVGRWGKGVNPHCLILPDGDMGAHWNPDPRDWARLWRGTQVLIAATRCHTLSRMTVERVGTPPRPGFPICWVKSGLRPTRVLLFSLFPHHQKTRGLSVIEHPARSPQHQGRRWPVNGADTHSLSLSFSRE